MLSDPLAGRHAGIESPPPEGPKRKMLIARGGTTLGLGVWHEKGIPRGPRVGLLPPTTIRPRLAIPRSGARSGVTTWERDRCHERPGRPPPRPEEIASTFGEGS
jgi:hypothetical protein